MGRTSRFGSTTAALLAALLPTIGSAEPVRLEPSSNWLVDYADERCSLSRTFGTGEQAVQLRIDSFGSWRDYRWLVTGRAVPRAGRSFGELKLRFSPDAEDRKANVLNGTVSGASAVSFTAAFAPPDPLPGGLSPERARVLGALSKPVDTAFEKRVTSLSMRFANGRTIDLALGEMDKPLEAMRACVDDLYKSWGLDPAVQKSLSRSAIIDTSTIRAVQARFPPSRLRTAYVPIRLLVDSRGKVTGCVDQAAIAPEEFMQAACTGLEAGNFAPALDAAGNPVASVYHTSVIYL
jgi:hypothetical protein